MLNEVFALLGQIIVGAGAAAAFAWWLFRTFADKWLQSKFDAQLESLRHQQAREIETLRFELGKLSDRALKLQEREFDKLPKLWEQLSEAYGRVYRLAVGFQQLPDLDAYDAEHLDAFLGGQKDMPEFEKKRLRESTRRTDLFIEISRRRELYDASRATNEFHNALLTSRIFLTREVARALTETDRLIRTAFIEQSGDAKWRQKSEGSSSMKLITDGEKIIEGVETIVRERIWSSGDEEAKA